MSEALVGKELGDLTALLASAGAQSFRARQLYHALYRQRIEALESVSVLPSALRARLAREFVTGLPEQSERFTSKDGTVRYVLRLADGKTVELR